MTKQLELKVMHELEQVGAATPIQLSIKAILTSDKTTSILKKLSRGGYVQAYQSKAGLFGNIFSRFTETNTVNNSAICQLSKKGLAMLHDTYQFYLN